MLVEIGSKEWHIIELPNLSAASDSSNSRVTSREKLRPSPPFPCRRMHTPMQAAQLSPWLGRYALKCENCNVFCSSTATTACAYNADSTWISARYGPPERTDYDESARQTPARISEVCSIPFLKSRGRRHRRFIIESSDFCRIYYVVLEIDFEKATAYGPRQLLSGFVHG